MALKIYSYGRGGVKFSMKTLQHVGHARAKRAFNGVALKKGKGDYNEYCIIKHSSAKNKA